jgi:hypothetical protein
VWPGMAARQEFKLEHYQLAFTLAGLFRARVEWEHETQATNAARVPDMHLSRSGGAVVNNPHRGLDWGRDEAHAQDEAQWPQSEGQWQQMAMQDVRSQIHDRRVAQPNS